MLTVTTQTISKEERMQRLNDKLYRLRSVNNRYGKRYHTLQVPREYVATLRDTKAVRFEMYIDDGGCLVVVPRYE